MKVTTYIAKFLKEKGIECVFELQGGMITRIIDEIYREGGIKIVSMHHEQAASFAADAYARVTNKPGVAMATSGPGATNLITGIGSCYFDSVPAIFITGQVNLNEQKGNRITRQLGFQETEIIPIVKPITKAAYAITSPNDIPLALHEAYNIATTGRPGPVLIDIPMNIQNMEMSDLSDELDGKAHLCALSEDIDGFINSFLKELRVAKKPLILAGRGIAISKTQDCLAKTAEILEVPIVTSLLGFDVLPYNSPLRIGFIGSYGNRWANYALGESDLLLVLGSRLDLRQTGADVETFKKGKKIFHVDIDAAELNNRIEGCYTVQADLRSFFSAFSAQTSTGYNAKNWLAEIKEKYTERKDTDELRNIRGINPNKFIHQLSRESKLAKAITTDVGNNQMWTSQSWESEQEQQFLSSGGMGAMGYSLPAAIGASFANNKSPVVSISGDGGFQINIQELQTIKRNKLPIKIVILNNQCLGMIRQFQDSYFDSCYQSTVWGYSSPDFAQVATAYGIDAMTIDLEEQINDAIQKLWENPEHPFLLNVKIDIHTNVYPKMLFGNPLTQMEFES
ncbi:thiamine pyrophosphate-binding protein [Mangrovibacterium lignilyticum]|uniref:thiamine pyrophosphate-binding protein n=1 Tax=Mangrovibacterium lignilyticum TaxID=2668052 RepID=UPI0013D66A9E|nr:thiamine pyrophosphate-binding protein [Mangrovibacterium lignilyticum]